MGQEFHPDLRRIARLLPSWELTGTRVRRMRAPSAIVDRLVTRRSRGVEVAQVDPHTSVRLFRPATGALDGRALLWIHGGGYVIGSASMDDALCQAYADRLRATVASVDYRLAPENPHPAALEDCYAALTWLAGRAESGRDRVAVAGASAGGGLAAALALLARDRGEITLAAQVLVYPMLDDRTCLRPATERHKVWTQDSNRFAWHSYLGQAPGSAGVSPYAAAARAENLTGLPPTWIGVGTRDLFHDEALVYAARLREAGVACAVETVPGAFHGFDIFARNKEVSRSFFESQIRAFEAYLTVGPAR